MLTVYIIHYVYTYGLPDTPDLAMHTISNTDGAIQIFHGPTLVAMVTKIGLFSHKIVYNSAVVLGSYWDLEGRVCNC